MFKLLLFTEKISYNINGISFMFSYDIFMFSLWSFDVFYVKFYVSYVHFITFNFCMPFLFIFITFYAILCLLYDLTMTLFSHIVFVTFFRYLITWDNLWHNLCNFGDIFAILSWLFCLFWNLFRAILESLYAILTVFHSILMFFL